MTDGTRDGIWRISHLCCLLPAPVIELFDPPPNYGDLKCKMFC